MKNWKSLILPCGIGLIVCVLSLLSAWNDDAIAYSFFVTEFDEDNSFISLNSFADIWHSQTNHYFNHGGRFFVHFIVQYFCGIAGKIPFAICNGLVWALLVFLFFRLTNAQEIRQKAFLLILIYFLLGDLPFTPPFQINYVWTACATLLWIQVFFSGAKPGPTWLILWFPVSFLIGEMHEGFSFPIDCAVCAFLIFKKGRFTPLQLFSAISYLIGSAVVALAPGNFVRLGEVSGRGSHLAAFIEGLPILLWMPAIIFVTLWAVGGFRERSWVKKFFSSDIDRFVAVGACAVVAFLFVFQFLGRATIPLNMFLIILLMRYLANKRLPLWLPISCFMVAVPMFANNCRGMYLQNEKTDAIIREYSASDTGRIFLPDELFLYNHTEATNRRNTYTNLLRNRQSANKPYLVIYPESMRNMPLDKDTNMLIKISDQAWVCIQSASHPAEFVVDKTFLPSVISKKLTPRILDFDSKEIQLDSNAFNKSVIYINSRPYLHSEVFINP